MDQIRGKEKEKSENEILQKKQEELIEQINSKLKDNYDVDVVKLSNELQNIKIYDPKMDELFKTIFGNEKRKNITARFLNDLIDLNVNANDITFVNNELLFNEYQPNQKRPVVDINMIISSNSNNNLEATSSNSESLRNEKIENKKVIVEMQVFN